MKVLFATSEILPFASTGGLGEVSAFLPAALQQAGVELIRVMPMYRRCLEHSFKKQDTGLRLKIPMGFRLHTAEVWMTTEGRGPATYFIRRDEYFDRREIYSLPDRDYTDNFERFVFFQKAVIGLADALEFKADVIHGNDWTCGLIPLFAAHGMNGMGRNGGERHVFTIHNLAYQGLFPGAEFPLTNLPFSCFSIDGMEFYGNINCIKAALNAADVSTTVSENYAKECRTPERGYGLDGVIRNLGDRFVGIRNGVDYSDRDPATDPYLDVPYTHQQVEGKAENRASLLKEIGWTDASRRPVLCMLTRLVPEKGLDLLRAILPRLMSMNVRLVILGTGWEQYHQLCQEWMAQWPDRFFAAIRYDVAFSHRLLAGADILLMPSKSEPCGLSQLYGLRYGVVPVCHATGGLVDTVKPISSDGAQGNGFLFEPYTPEAFLKSIEQALGLFVQQATWTDICQRVMREDHSWAGPASRYLDIYERVLSAKRG